MLPDDFSWKPHKISGRSFGQTFLVFRHKPIAQVSTHLDGQWLLVLERHRHFTLFEHTRWESEALAMQVGENWAFEHAERIRQEVIDPPPKPDEPRLNRDEARDERLKRS